VRESRESHHVSASKFSIKAAAHSPLMFAAWTMTCAARVCGGEH